jgi:hypothetical protein
MHNADYKGGAWAIVSIDASELPGKAVRINITLPKRVLKSVDRFAKAAGETRSGLLSEAATQYIKARTQRGEFRK